MKIAVYTIAKNEEQFVKRWYESAKEADYLLIADTGSTDSTVEIAKSLGINIFEINVSPWRFDDARNTSLALIPADIDYCIALDMDEILVEGWRQELEKIDSTVTRPRYKFTWNFNEDGSPGLQFSGTKIHSRHGYRWKHPVHEVIAPDRINDIEGWVGLEIHHHADNSKSRSSYLPLLKQSVIEDPNDDRNVFYYGRELFFYKEYTAAAEQFRNHLNLPKATWKPERAQSMRYLAKCEPDNQEYWILKSIDECPGRRESLVDAASYYYNISNWDKCSYYSSAALDIVEKPLDYLCEAEAWGWLPYDLKAIADYNLGRYKDALEAGEKAYSINQDERLANNLVFYKKAYEGLML